MATALRARGLARRFGAVRALDRVGLVLQEGEVHGLLGPNGAGKTTLLRVLLGLVAPDAGSVELFGRELQQLGRSPCERVAGFVEEPSFYPYLSARANLEILSQLDGGPAPAAVIERALARVGLGEHGRVRVGGFSSGMRKRLGLAASLLRSPRILLLDEPAAGLDPAGLHELAALITELASDGVAVLLSSHQIAEVERVCASFTFLRQGAVAWSGTAEELRAAAPAGVYRLLTSDDALALTLAAGREELSASAPHAGEIELVAGDAQLDRYVLDLGRAGVAVRRLELLTSPVESLYFALTAAPPRELDPAATAQRAPAAR